MYLPNGYILMQFFLWAEENPQLLIYIILKYRDGRGVSTLLSL